MIEEFCNVRIKKSGITGTVVDISNVSGKFIIECDEADVPNGYGPENRLLDCAEDELELLE